MLAGENVMARAKIKFDVHPGVAMIQKWVAELPAKTSRSIEQWSELARTQGPKDRRDRKERDSVQRSEPRPVRERSGLASRYRKGAFGIGEPRP
ncbi:MAG TPA: hypothetical protein VGL71_10095 [Urbifossiella sp.]|jgi:hypothetical protein